MAKTATIRDLRNRFPAVKELVEQEGEVLVTDRGMPKYRLTLYTGMRRTLTPPAKDYMARIRRYQRRRIGRAAARRLHEENRADR